MAKKKAPTRRATLDDLIASGIRFTDDEPAQEVAAPAPAPERTWGGVAKDVGITALKGAIGVPEAAVGVADLVSGGRAGKLAEEAGFRPKEAKAMLDEGYSEKQKAAFQKVQAAEGLGNTFMAAVQNPSVIGHSVVESLPSMAAGGVLARGAMALAPKLGGVVAGALGEGAVGAGSSAEQIRQQTADGLLTGEQAALGAATGVLTSGFAMLGGKIAQKLGIADVDTMLAGAATNPAVAKGLTRSALEGAFSEGILEELPQSVSEQVLQNMALGRPLEDGVNQAIVLGALSGGLMGGGANVISGVGAPTPVIVAPPPPPPGPLGRAAGKAPAPEVPPAAPMPPPPEQAMALIDHANERARQIEEKAKGTKDQTITGADGQPVVIPGRKPEFLTPEEKEEQAFLKEHGGDATVLANVYPDLVKAPQAEPPSQTPTGQDAAGLLALPENPLIAGASATQADKASEQQHQAAMAKMERQSQRDLADMRQFDRAPSTGATEIAPVDAAPVDDPGALPFPEPGDTLNKQGSPFKNRLAAVNAQKASGGDLVQVIGGWVVRPTAATKGPDATQEAATPPATPPATPTADALPVPAVQPAATEPAGEGSDAVVSSGDGAVTDALTNEQDEPLQPAGTEAQAAPVEAPAPEGSDAAPAGPVPATGDDAGVQSDGVATSDQFQSYQRAIEAADTVGTGMLDQIRADERLNDGESDQLVAMATPKTKAAKKLPYVSKEDGEHLFGVDQKRQKAIERINKGTAYFGTPEKARDFIKANGLKDTHEVVQSKPGRFEVRAKSAEPSDMQAADAPDWWKNKTPAERVWTLKASGIKGTAVTPWSRIAVDDQKRLNDQWGPKEAAPAEDQPAQETAIDRRNRMVAERETAPADPEPKPAAPQVPNDRAPKKQTTDNESLTVDVEPVAAETPAAPAPTPKPAKPDPLTEQEKAAKAKMLGAAAKLADLLSKNTRASITPEQEQKMLPIVIELFEGAMDLGYVKFKQAARYVREFIANAIDQDAADAIPIDTLQGAYIATARRHADKDITRKGEVVAVETLADLEEPGQEADTGAPKDGNATRQLDQPSAGTLGGAPAQDVRAPEGGRDAGAGTDGGSGSDLAGNARPDDAGGNAGGSLGGDTGAVPVPGGRARANAQDAKKRRLPRAPRTEQGDGLFGATGGLTPDTGANPAPNAPPIATPQPAAQDFTITDELTLGEGGQKTKFKNNIAAIRLLRDLEATGRMAAPDEQAVLAKYIGWGGLPQAFDAQNADWAKEHAEITALMSPEELASARQSTRYAHYTSKEIVVDGIYAAMRHFGFNGGKTLESGAGVGNFIGMMPADMRSAGRFTAIEREPFSSAIARQLYPQQSVQRADFTEFKGNDAYFDAAVGNPPFASDAQTDRSGRKHLSGLSLHNYFFAKSIDMLREGGIMAQVVTNSFMDAKGDKARKYISDRAELLGAIRLPNSAFSKNAGTEVTTDLIFLKKRPDSEVGGKAARADAKRWMESGIYTDKSGKQVALNQYFIDHPDMMLGDFGAHGTMYGPDKPALVANPGQDTLALLKAAVGKLPAGVYKSIAETGSDTLVNAAVVALKNPSVKEGGYFVDGDKLMQRLPDIAGEARGVEVTPATQWTAKTSLGESGFDRIKALAGLRTTVRGLLAAEMDDDAAAMKTLRATLNTQYDAYRDTHGLINDPSTLRVFDDDPDFPLLASLEHGYTPGMGPVAAKRMGVKPTKSTAKKGPIFTQRVVAVRQAVQKVDTPADALAVSMAERGRLDAAYIGQLLGMDPDEVLRELSTGDKPLLFRDPLTDEYVLRDAYLSGNVRAKLVQAKQSGMFSNITELEAVQPEDVGSHEIVARLGSPWVPTDVYRDFAKALYGEEAKVSVFYLAANSSFQVLVYGGSDVSLTNTWGTKDYPGDALVQAVMNNRSIKVTYRDTDGKTHTDVDATEKANNKAQEIKDRFNDWIFSDPERSELLTKAYNETNNNYVTRVYDGSNMTFPGKVPDSIIKFRRHQRNAIARIVYDRTALLDHVVGAGKTFTVVAGAMELKRTGLARKPMVAVPNHLVKQWAADFYRLYPGANVLTATKKDFEKANRRKFLAKIATGDWDAVVIAHSSYGFIKPAPEFEAEFNGREIQKIMATIKNVEDSDGEKQTKKRTIKQLEGMKERLENRIRQLRDKPMDDLLDFEQIGVDQLFVDEAHMFKNLMYTTKMQGVAGLNDPTGSQRAYDMYVKTNQVMEKNGRGQGVVFATGTPVSNSLAEMYHMMRYLMPTQMRELGFESFDAWANTYASVEQVWMQSPSGDGFKAQNRMSNFVNTPELLKMFDQVSDTVTMDDIKKAYSEENDGAEFPLPKLKGGRRTPVSLEKSAAQDAYMADIAKRAKAIEQRNGPPQKGQDNILVVMSDARKAAMDIRLVDHDVTTREPGGRIDRSTDEVVERYKKYNAVKGTQLVFSDLGTPLKHAKKELAEYEALQARVQAGTEDVATSATLGNEAAMETMEDAEAAQAELDAMGPDWLSAVKAAMLGFSIYDDFKAALIEKGVPEAEIAFIHDYNTDDQKAALFRKVNAGQIRVLLGSTAKLGAGTNVQERLVAEHHLDVPWRPSDVEQREGRIERQGNILMTEWPDFEIEILAYVTRDTLDMRMWQVQETKLKMINQLRTRKIGREIDNAFEDMELSAGEMQAAATGDINLLKEIQLRNDVKKLEQRRRSFDGQKNDLISRKRRNAELLRELPAKLEEAETEAVHAAQYRTDLYEKRPPFAMNIDGKDYDDASEAQAVLRALDDATEELKALNGEVTSKKKPLSVTINGELIKNRATMAELFSAARGDVSPIAWDFGGETYRRRATLATGIRARVLDAIADENTQQVGTIGAYSVAVEGSSDKNGNPILEVTMRRGGQVVMSNSFNASDSGNAAGRVITMTEHLLESAVREAGYLSSSLSRAKKDAAELAKVEVSGAWPDQGKLDAAREAHKAVLAVLKQKEATQPVDPDAQAEQLSIDAGTPAADTEAHGPATQAHRDAAAKFVVGFAQRIDGGSDKNLLDAVAPGDGTRGRAAAAVAAAARRLFGVEVVFVKFSGKPLFNGAVSKLAPGYIFINIDSQKPFMAVLGHELLHHLSRNQPGIYAALSNRIDALIKGETTYAIRTVNAYREAGISLAGLDTREELEADIVGDFFTDGAFWSDLAKDKPGLFKRIANAIVQWLDSVVAKLGKQRPFGTEEFLTDIEAARAAVVDAMGQFSGTEVGAVTDPVDRDMKLSVAGKTGRTGSEADAIAAGFTMRAYRGTSKANPFNDTGTTWLTTDRAVAEAYAEEVMGYEDPDVLTVMVKPDGLKRSDASRLTDEEREALGSDGFGNPQAVGIYDRSDDHPLGGSRRNVTVIHAPKQAVWVVRDTADADTQLSITGEAPNDPRAMVDKAREAVTDLFNAPGKLNWWHKSVGTQYNLAQRSPGFKRVFDRVQDFLNDVSYHATEAADLAPNILPKLDTWRDIFRSPLTPEDNKAIAAPIFEGTLAWRRDESGAPVRMSDAEAAAGDLTTEQKAQRLLRGDHVTERTLKMWRGLPLEQYEAIIDGKFERDMLAAGVVWTNSELVSMFSLTPAQTALYREFRAATDKSLNTLAISDMLRFGGQDVAFLRDEAMQSADASAAAQLLRDYLLEAADMDDDRRDVLIDTANKMIDKADKVDGLTQRGYAPLSRFGHYSLDVVDDAGERVYFGLFESQGEANKMARAMRANFPGAQIRQGTMSEEAYKLFAGVSPETLELFGGMLGLEAGGTSAGDKVFQEYLKLAKGNRSAMKRLIQRKGVAGFSEDAGRVLAGFIYSNARQTSSSLHMGDIADAANAIPNQQGELKDAALKLMDYIKNPVEEASKFRGLLFAQYLGGSLASAMVNMTQPVAVTVPYLSQFGGVRGAAMEMKNALADVLKKSTGDAALDAALKKSEEDGIVAPQEVHQLMAQAQGSGTLKPGDGTTMGNAKAKANNAVAKLSLAWGKAFGAAEQFNRRLTFIASYRLAQKQGMKNPAKFAERTIAETQFIYNKGNKPKWARGAVGGTVFTFKQYSIAYMELLTRMAANGPEGKRAALMAVGVLMLMGGAGGLPFMEDLEDVIDGILQRLGYNFSTKQKRKELLADAFGADAARFIDTGISGLPGAPIDVSGRLGLGNLIPGTGLLVKKDNYTRDAMEVVGPAGDFITRGFQAANKLAAGDVGKAAETLAPVAVRNLTKAIDMATTGMYRDDRGRKVLDVDGFDTLAKGIGFQPNDVERVQEGSFASQKMISLNKITEAEIAGDWAVGLFEGDQAKVRQAREDMLEWNRKNPESPIRINMGQVLKRVRAMRTSKEDRIAATAPKEIRATVRRELASGV